MKPLHGRALWVLGLLAGLGLGVGRPAQARGLDVEQGLTALRDGQDAEAWRLLSPEAMRPHAPAELRFWAADAAARLGRPDDALMLLQGLDKLLVPVADEVFLRVARAHAALGNTREAIEAYTQMLARDPLLEAAKEARFALGPLWVALDNRIAAIVALGEAVALAPRDLRADGARLHMARLQLLEGNIEGARAQLSWLSGHAKDPVALDAAQALVDLEREHPRVPLAPEAAAQEDAAPSWQTTLGLREAQRLAQKRKTDEAVAALNRLVHRARGRTREGLAQELGNTLAQAGRTDEAVKAFDALAGWTPAGVRRQEAQFRAAYLSYDAKHYAAAKKRFTQWLGLYPRARTRDEALWFAAWCGYHLGQYEAALVDLGRLRHQHPTSAMVPRAQYWSARMLEARKRHAEAQALYEAGAQRAGYYGYLSRQRRLTSYGRAQPNHPLQLPLSARIRAPEGAPPGHTPATLQNLDPTAADEETLAQALTRGAESLDWEHPSGRRVSTLIRLGLKAQAAARVTGLRGRPGQSRDKQVLGRAQILYALGDATRAMREVVPVLPTASMPELNTQNLALWQLAYPAPFVAEVSAAAREFFLSDLFVLSVMRQESAFNLRAASPVSAQGLMQIMPQTGRRIAQALGIADYQDASLLTPACNIRFAGWYLRQLLDRFGQNHAVAIAAYNAGPTAVSQWLQAPPHGATDVFVEDVPYRETRDYIKKVVANLDAYSVIYSARTLDWTPQLTTPDSRGVAF